MAQASTPSCRRSEVSPTARPADQGRQQLRQTRRRARSPPTVSRCLPTSASATCAAAAGGKPSSPGTCGCCVDSDFPRPTRLPYISTGGNPLKMANGVGVTGWRERRSRPGCLDPGGHRSRRADLARLQPQVQPQRSSEGVSSGQRGSSAARMAAVRRSNCLARESISARKSSIPARSLRSPRRLAHARLTSSLLCTGRAGAGAIGAFSGSGASSSTGLCRCGAKSPANI